MEKDVYGDGAQFAAEAGSCADCFSGGRRMQASLCGRITCETLLLYAQEKTKGKVSFFPGKFGGRMDPPTANFCVSRCVPRFGSHLPAEPSRISFAGRAVKHCWSKRERSIPPLATGNRRGCLSRNGTVGKQSQGQVLPADRRGLASTASQSKYPGGRTLRRWPRCSSRPILLFPRRRDEAHFSMAAPRSFLRP